LKEKSLGFKPCIKPRNLIKPPNLSVIEKNYIFGIELRAPLSLQTVANDFSLKRKEIFKDHVHIWPVLFENSHVSQVM